MQHSMISDLPRRRPRRPVPDPLVRDGHARHITLRNPPRHLAAHRGAPASGPQTAFAAAVLLAFAALVMSWLFLPPDLALPLTSTLLLVLAAVIWLVGRNRS